MLPQSPVIGVVGTGAVGGFYGARLARAGYPVRFLLRSDYEAVAARGLAIHSTEGDFSLAPGSIGVYRAPQDMGPVDLVLVALKATANDQYASLIPPLLHERTMVLTLQNGLGHEQRLADLFGAARILGGLAFVCLNRTAPGVIRHLGYGYVQVAQLLGGDTPDARAVAAMFARAGVNCRVLPDLNHGRWEKLLWNIPFNGLGALLDLATDALVGTESGLDVLRGLMQEVIAAARANGANLPDEMIEHKIEQTRTMGAYRSSMQLDRQAGRAMEVEAILGEPVRAAEAAGVAVPRMRMLHRLLQLVNMGKRA